MHLCEFGVQNGELQTENFNSAAPRMNEVMRQQRLKRRGKILKIFTLPDEPLSAARTLAELAYLCRFFRL